MQDIDNETFSINQLTFDIVIATRNRPDALSVSLPMMLSQSRLPEQLIIIDSSDDHEAVRASVAEATAEWGGKVILEHTGPGTPFQRDRGVSLATSDVVIIPDDDSLFYPGAIEAIMGIYERDTDCLIAGVGGAETRDPPADLDLSKTYAISTEHRREAWIKPYRHRLEKRFRVLNPKVYLGQRLFDMKPAPEWLAEMDALPAVYLTGFRMSFRTSAIRAHGFDPTLTGYTTEDDVDASFSAAREGILVVADKAKVFHHRFPGKRGNGFRVGRTGTLNLLYVGLKHAENPDFSASDRLSIRRRLRIFMYLQLMVALTRVSSKFGRERLAGTWAALRASEPLWSASASGLSAAYARATETANQHAPKLNAGNKPDIVSS